MSGTPSSTGSTSRSVAWSVGVSLAFWMCLLASGGCFAVVALAPKYIQWQRLNEQFAVNQHHLVAVEQRTLQLRQVVAALEEDPAFVEELARVEFDAIRPGEEVIPVEPALQLDARMTANRVAPMHGILPGWQTWLAQLAAHQELQSVLLLTSAVLVIAAFTWLHEPGEPDDAPRAKRSWWRRLRDRYVAG